MAKESNFKNMVICLSAICLVCSALLGSVYVLTSEAIAKTKTDKINRSISLVVPTFDNDPSSDIISVEHNGKQYRVYPAQSEGKYVGYAIESSTNKGFSGTIVLMVGFTPDGLIYNTSVVSHSETPGLGDKMEQSKSNFSLQFNGKSPANMKMAVKKDGGDIDAISASTITSRAFIDAVETAYQVFLKINPNK